MELLPQWRPPGADRGVGLYPGLRRTACSSPGVMFVSPFGLGRTLVRMSILWRKRRNGNLHMRFDEGFGLIPVPTRLGKPLFECIERNSYLLLGTTPPPWEDKSCVSHSRVPLRFTQSEKPCRLSEALILGEPFTPGSAPLRQGLLMVSRLRRWMPKIKNGFWEKAFYSRRKSS